ncbi:MAG: sterol desaturase family protein [Acetobacteraceae bacterium]|nr:sterol desaturase family protein [Acetobacteraceae bacterium]
MTITMLTTAPFWQRLSEHVRDRLAGEEGIVLLLLWLTIIVAGVATYLHETPDARSIRGFLRHMLPRGTFRHPSARADLWFWLSRRVFMPLLVLPLVISTVTAGHGMYWLLTQLIGVPERLPGHASPLVLCLFTVTMLLAYDLSYYIYHYAQHKVPMLWELHKVHHSAQVMIGVTKDRVHPLDELMNHWWDGVIPGLCYGVWLFFALDPIEVTIFGLNVYALRNVLLMMDFIRHSHLKFSYGPFLDQILLSPHHHQLHHSIAERHWDKNFGLTLIVWDRLFGTAAKPEPGETFVFGLTDNEADEYQSLYQLHVLPLKKIASRVSRAVARNRPVRLFQSKA